VTHFTATKQIVYKAGQGFSGSPGEVTARTQCFTEGIGSSRGRLIGRIIRRQAAEQIAENKALTTEIARQKAQRQIAAAFERRMDERIAHLNQMVESQSLWGSLMGGSGRMPYACCSTHGHLQIAAAHPRESRPIALPVRGPASSCRGGRVVGSQFAAAGTTPGLLNRLAQTSLVLNACVGPAALIKKQSLAAASPGSPPSSIRRPSATGRRRCSPDRRTHANRRRAPRAVTAAGLAAAVVAA
jgi:hypothetical protein